jgi:uncharacterized protein YdeI (YjbR/CyaY-like superfamily)
METINGIKTFHTKTRNAWRKWLEKNQSTAKSVWLILYHKKSKIPCITYDEAVEEALCFGWIDSKTNKHDAESYVLYFTRRSPKSNWSRSNRERVERLIEQGRMTASGGKMIDLAKKTGTWTALEDAQRSVIPDDLKKEFNKNKTAFNNFNAFSPSAKRIILEWILNAKRADTRKKRIEETVRLAEKNIKANHYVQ